MTTDRKRGYLYILLAAMLYSTTEVALKALGGAFAPMQVTVERVLLGAVALMPFALNDLKKRDIQLTKADWGYFTLLGFLTVTLHMSLLQMAVLHMDASATSIIYSGNPVFAVALAHFILHEPLKKNHLLAIGVELVGILFILNPAHLEISLRGFLEIITATLLFATYGTLCKLRLPRLGALVITTFNMLIGGLELLFLLLLGEIPAVGALYSGLGLEIFAGIPFFTGFTLKTTLLLCHVGIGCAAIGFLLTAKITEYTSATEASFVYLVKPILATALAVVVYHEHISVNRMVGIAFFVAASLCVSVPVLREMRLEYPGIRISLEAYTLQELSARFQMGQMDLIITLQDRTAKMYDAESMLIDTAQEMILFSNTLFRTRKKNWKPEEFRQETFFVLADDREEMQLDCVRAIGSKYGFVPNICSVNSMESILMNVENGLGVTVCNSWVRNVYEPGFQCCPLEHSTEIAAVWKQGQENSALQILLGYMTEKNLNSCKISA